MMEQLSDSLLIQLKSLIKQLNFKTNIPSQLQGFTLQKVCEFFMSEETNEPKFFLTYVNSLIRYLWHYKEQDDPITIVLYEAIKYNIQKNSEEYKAKLYQQSIIQYVLSINYEIYKLLMKPQGIWMNIDQNYDELLLKIFDPYSKRAQDFLDLLKSVIISLDDFKIFIQKFSQSYIDSASSGNQILQSAFFICLFEIIKIKGINTEQYLILTFFQRVTSQNFKLHYCALHTLSICLIVLDFSNSKEIYYRQFIRLIRLGLQIDEQSIVYLAMQCFILFVNKFGIKEQFSDILDYLQEKVVFFIRDPHFITLQNCCLDCLIELSYHFKRSNSDKVIKFIQICIDVIQQKIEKNNYLILDKAVKCMCQMISNIRNYQNIQYYLNCVLVNNLHLLQNNISTDTLLTSWNFLCLARIRIQNCTLLFSKILHIADLYCKDNSLRKRSLSYQTIKQTSRCFQIKFLDYLIPTLKMIQNCLQKAVQKVNIDQVSQICSVLDSIISNNKPLSKNFLQIPKKTNLKMIQANTNDQKKFISQILNQIMQIIDYFFQILGSTCSFNIKQSLLLSLRVIIEHYGGKLSEKYKDKFISYFFLIANTFNIQRFVKLQFNNLMLVIKKNQLKSQKNYYEAINRCINILPLVLESIIKDLPLSKIKTILPWIIKQIQQNKSDLDLNYGIRYLVCKIHCLTQKQINDEDQDNFSTIIQILSQHSTKKFPRIRAQVSYAVGIIVNKISFIESEKINDCLQILLRCMETIKSPKDLDEDQKACQDSTICSYGHIFYRLTNNTNNKQVYDDKQVQYIFYIWLYGLQFKYDKKDQKQQIQYLSDRIEQINTLIQSIARSNEFHQNSTLILVSKIVKIFLSVKNKIETQPRTRDNRDMLLKVTQAMNKMMQYDTFQNNVDKMKENFLSPIQREDLIKLMRKRI